MRRAHLSVGSEQPELILCVGHQNQQGGKTREDSIARSALQTSRANGRACRQQDSATRTGKAESKHRGRFDPDAGRHHDPKDERQGGRPAGCLGARFTMKTASAKVQTAVAPTQLSARAIRSKTRV